MKSIKVKKIKKTWEYGKCSKTGKYERYRKPENM